MTTSDDFVIVKVSIDVPPSPSKEPIIPPADHAFNCQPLLRVFLERTFLAVLVLASVGFLSWLLFTVLVYTKHEPNFQIDSASVNTSAVHDQFGDYVRADWRIVISSSNPNEHTAIVYKKVSVRMFRHLDDFGDWDAIAAPFRQEPGNQTTLIARSEPQSKGTKLRYDILETILEFNVTVQVELNYKCRTCLRERLVELEVLCPEVKVFHAIDGPGTGGSRQCSVQRKGKIH